MPEVKVKGKKGLRVPSKITKTVERMIRGGRDLVRGGRRRFARVAIAGEKKVKRVTKAGGRQVKRAWKGVKKTVT